MPYNPFDPLFENLPKEIPIFPLDGMVLLPRGELPLNIFEPRYLSMVADSLKGNRLVGVIQPHFKVGCVGRIVRFEETIDGRYLVSLRGLCRFHIGEDIVDVTKKYRRSIIDWDGFSEDMVRSKDMNVDKERLKILLRSYFEAQDLSMDWDLIDEVAEEGLFTTLAMVCPFASSEKQALLEANCCKERADLFIKLLEMAVSTAIKSHATPH